MSYAGPIYRFMIDYNSWHPSDRTVGSLLIDSDSPGQTQLTPPRIGDIVIAHDPGVAPDRWATVIDRHGVWLKLQTEGPVPTVKLDNESNLSSTASTFVESW